MIFNGETDSRRWYVYGVLFLIFLFHAINNFIVVGIDNTPLTSDCADLYAESLNYWHFLKQIDLRVHNFSELYYGFNHLVDRTPGLPLSAIPLYVFFNASYDTAVHVNIVYLLLLIGAVYGLGKELCHNKTCALLSVFILTMYPIMFGMSRVFIRDYGAAALVALSTYLLLRERKSSSIYASILTGGVVGFTLINRVTNSVFIIAPIILWLRHVVSMRGRGMWRVLLLLLSAGLVMSVWYPVSFWKYMIRHYPADGLGFECSGIKVFSVEGILFYLNTLVHEQLYLVFFAIFLGALAILLFQKKRSEQAVKFLFVQILVPYTFFCLVASKQVRFTIPYLWCFALLSAYGLCAIPKQKMRRIAIACVVIFGIIQYGVINYAPWSEKLYPPIQNLKNGTTDYIKTGLLFPTRTNLMNTLEAMKNKYFMGDEDVSVLIMEENGFLGHALMNCFDRERLLKGDQRHREAIYFSRIRYPDEMSKITHIIAERDLQEFPDLDKYYRDQFTLCEVFDVPTVFFIDGKLLVYRRIKRNRE